MPHPLQKTLPYIMNFKLWRSASLGLKLNLATVAIITSVLSIFVFALSHETVRQVEEQSVGDLRERIALLSTMFDATDRNFRQRTDELTKSFVAQLEGKLELRKQETVEIKGRATPLLTLDGRPLNLNFNLVDPFTKVTGAVATVFARSGEDFVRVSTSLQNEKGERAVGTLLAREHAGYKAVLGGGNYVGMATLFGRQYMTRYEPLRDSAGEIVGLAFVGMDITAPLTNLNKTVSDLRIGQSGYFFILDASSGKGHGTALVHPTQAGRQVLDFKDADGKPIYQEMIERKTGTIDYRLQNTERGEQEARAKVTVFTHLKAWGWVLAGGTYVDEFSADVRERRNRYVVIALVLLMLSSALFYVLIRRQVSRPLAHIRNSAQKIASGDLSARLDSKRADEIGELSHAVDRIGSSLAQVVGDVRANAESVATASAQIAQGNQDLSVRTESQAGALQQTAASGQQLEEAVRSNMEATEHVGALTQSARDMALEGRQAVTLVVDTMKAIDQTSKKVADITSLIDGIAFQTNILALNAAVEAARAGEQGRGFAVVASEVRSLAQRSADAAKAIKALIDTSVQRVAEGSSHANQAGEMMQDVVQSIERVSDNMTVITDSSKHQATGMQQLSGAMAQVDQATQQNAALVEEMAAAAGSLEQQAQQLVRSVAVFRLA